MSNVSCWSDERGHWVLMLAAALLVLMWLLFGAGLDIARVWSVRQTTELAMRSAARAAIRELEWEAYLDAGVRRLDRARAEAQFRSSLSIYLEDARAAFEVSIERFDVWPDEAGRPRLFAEGLIDARLPMLGWLTRRAAKLRVRVEVGLSEAVIDGP